MSDSCKNVLQDPYSLLCIRDMNATGQLQNPLLAFAFGADDKDQNCRDFWAKWSCCNVCLQSLLDEAAELNMDDLVSRTYRHLSLTFTHSITYGASCGLGGLPGLQCSLDEVSLNPQIGDLDGTCVLGPLVELKSRTQYKQDMCAGDFLANYVDAHPWHLNSSLVHPFGDVTPQERNKTTMQPTSAASRSAKHSWLMLAFAVVLPILLQSY